MSLSEIEQRILDAETSYQRQLTHAGKPRYDHSLTEYLKKDLDWLREQRDRLHESQNNSMHSGWRQ
jgi:hypothetical protein